MADETILVGGFTHETNTFGWRATTRADYRERRECFGDAVPAEFAGTNTATGGAIDEAERRGVDLRCVLAASAMPGGALTRETYEFYADRLLDGVREHHEAVDGVLLPLHGAMVAEHLADGEGELLARVREAVGPALPVVATLDLHGNVTPEMVAHADALVAYETYPHTDMGETGREGLRVLLETVRGDLDPVTWMERPPVLPFGPKQNTLDGPMAAVMALARDLESRDAIRKVNVLPGFHAADVEPMGFSVPVVADGDEAAARSAAREVASHVWANRESFVGDYPGPDDGVREAIDLAAGTGAGEGPVVVADVGDNPGGGGAADGTAVLRALLERGATNAGFALVCDPAVVETAVGAGVGERVTVSLGGKTDDMHGDPIDGVVGYVAAVTDGEYVNTGPMATGTANHLGRTVRLQCVLGAEGPGGAGDRDGGASTGDAAAGPGPRDGVTVVVTENRVQPLDAEIWRHVGVQPERLAVLVVKSTNHYRADYGPMASHVVPINSPGVASMDASVFEFARVRRPQFPLDEMADDAYPDWD